MTNIDLKNLNKKLELKAYKAEMRSVDLENLAVFTFGMFCILIIIILSL